GSCLGQAQSRIRLPLGSKTATCTTVTVFYSPKMSKLCRLAQCFSLFGFNFHPNGPDESQQFASYCGDPLFRCFFAARHELSVAPSNFTHLFQFRDTLVRISPLRDLQRLLYVGELGT